MGWKKVKHIENVIYKELWDINKITNIFDKLDVVNIKNDKGIIESSK